MTTIINDEIVDELLEDEDLLDFDVIDDFEDIEKEEEQQAIWHRLITKNKWSDWEDNYFDEEYFEE